MADNNDKEVEMASLAENSVGEDGADVPLVEKGDTSAEVEVDDEEEGQMAGGQIHPLGGDAEEEDEVHPLEKEHDDLHAEVKAIQKKERHVRVGHIPSKQDVLAGRQKSTADLRVEERCSQEYGHLQDYVCEQEVERAKQHDEAKNERRMLRSESKKHPEAWATRKHIKYEEQRKQMEGFYCDATMETIKQHDVDFIKSRLLKLQSLTSTKALLQLNRSTRALHHPDLEAYLPASEVERVKKHELDTEKRVLQRHRTSIIRRKPSGTGRAMSFRLMRWRSNPMGV